MVQAAVIKYGLILLAVLAIAGGVWAKIYTMNVKMRVMAAEVFELTGKLNQANHELERATQARDQLTAALLKAGQQRKLIRAELDSTLQRMQAQKPPSECKAAIEWAVEQKGDLSWPK